MTLTKSNGHRIPVARPSECSHGHSLKNRSSVIVWRTAGRVRWACKKCRAAHYEPLHSRAARSGGKRRREWAAGLGTWGTYVWGGAFERDLKAGGA